MRTYPDIDHVRAYARSGLYRTMPVMTELLADMFTPISVLRRLQRVSDHCYVLESAEDAERWGRYSFLGFDPKAELSVTDGVVRLVEDGKVTEERTDDPAAYVRRMIDAHAAPRISGMPSFTGGLVGYFSYDYIRYAEPKLKLCGKGAHFRDLDLMLFDKVIAFDNLRHKLLLIVTVDLTGDPDEEYAEAVEGLKALVKLVRDGREAADRPLVLRSDFSPRRTPERYYEMVERAKAYIREGDIFQAVLANRMEADAEGSLLDVYRLLRCTNPSPYMFYFSGSDIELAGASPETLVKLEDGVLHTFPLAGTRRRGRDDDEDKRLERELLSDEKELAEHNMLVDLGRNDLGRISETGSVHVEKYMEIERFSHVMHIGSTIAGTLRGDKDYMDAIASVLPAGTLSGAPKFRACEIIDELEGISRGVYGGAVGYIDFRGNLDVCIAIRMAYAKAGKVYVCSGAGIVADSVPENEYAECINKAKAVTNAVAEAAGGVE